MMSHKRSFPPSEEASVVSSAASEEPSPKRQRTDAVSTDGPFIPSRSIEGVDLFGYFRQLPHDSNFDHFFGDPVVAIALFRSLDDAEKIIVTRSLSLPEASRWEPFLVWLRGNRKEAIRALNSLRSLHVLTIRPQRRQQPTRPSRPPSSRPSEDGGSALENTTGAGAGSVTSASGISTSSKGKAGIADARYELHSVFRRTLQQTIRGSSHHACSNINKAPKHFPTRETLQNHAATRWSNMLQWLCEGASVMDNQNTSDIGLRLRALFVANQPSSRPPLSFDVVTVLRRLRLIQTPNRNDSSHARDRLPNETFQWLLLDIRSQLLSICIEFLHCLHFDLLGETTNPNIPPSIDGMKMMMATMIGKSVTPTSTEITSKNRTEVLCLLFTLAESLIGQPCSVAELTPVQIRFLGLAYDIGLIWMHKPRGAKHFFPTPFAKLLQCDGPDMAHLTSAISTLTALRSSLSSSSPTSPIIDLPSNLYHTAYARFFSHEKLADYPPHVENSSDSQSSPASTATARLSATETGVIVESNFKVFSYTASSLLITVVARLCEVRVITPNLVVGNLSRDSVLEAYKSGVTADQIIRFFSAHAHPSIYTKSRREEKPIIPENVSTQLRIWEAERRRVRMRRACVFEFSKESDIDVFPLAVAKAGAGWLLMHTVIPASSNPNSEGFQDWKTKVIAKLRERPAAGELQKATAPVLAVQIQRKDDMTSFIRNSLRNVKR